MAPASITTELTYTAGPDDAGERLDRVLARREPSAGLRGWRRLCAAGRVRVNDRPAPAGLKLRSGQRITVMPGTETNTPGTEQPCVVAVDENFAALYKPPGWHSAALTGDTGPSLEKLLAHGHLLPAVNGRAPLLLNRLDRQTSGLVMAARSPAGSGRWRAAEDAGLVDKAYLAVTRGLPARVLLCRNRLDTGRGRRVRVLPGDNPDPLRHTTVSPDRLLTPSEKLALAPDLADEAGLVVCRIRKGARHQIRAHLAGAGFPLIGDPLYGAGQAGERFLLHHGRISLPGFAASCPPPWPLESWPPLEKD